LKSTPCASWLANIAPKRPPVWDRRSCCRSESKEQRADEHPAYFPVALIHCSLRYILHGHALAFVENKVNQKVRLMVLAAAVLIFGVLFRSQTEPVRALVQFSRRWGWGVLPYLTPCWYFCIYRDDSSRGEN
jgi:hypothetical protein